MKHLLTVLLLGVILAISSCGPCGEDKRASDEASTEDSTRSLENGRIKLIEKYNSADSYTIYEIISVDGKEFLANSKGGIIPLNPEPTVVTTEPPVIQTPTY
jgi:hypothetical protein